MAAVMVVNAPQAEATYIEIDRPAEPEQSR